MRPESDGGLHMIGSEEYCIDWMRSGSRLELRQRSVEVYPPGLFFSSFVGFSSVELESSPARSQSSRSLHSLSFSSCFVARTLGRQSLIKAGLGLGGSGEPDESSRRRAMPASQAEKDT